MVGSCGPWESQGPALRLGSLPWGCPGPPTPGGQEGPPLGALYPHAARVFAPPGLLRRCPGGELKPRPGLQWSGRASGSHGAGRAGRRRLRREKQAGGSGPGHRGLAPSKIQASDKQFPGGCSFPREATSGRALSGTGSTAAGGRRCPRNSLFWPHGQGSRGKPRRRGWSWKGGGTRTTTNPRACSRHIR